MAMRPPRAPAAPGVTIVGNPGPKTPTLPGVKPGEDEEGRDSFWDKLLSEAPAPLRPTRKP